MFSSSERIKIENGRNKTDIILDRIEQEKQVKYLKNKTKVNIKNKITIYIDNWQKLCNNNLTRGKIMSIKVLKNSIENRENTLYECCIRIWYLINYFLDKQEIPCYTNIRLKERGSKKC